jgi:hypothetical protein
LKFKVSLNKLKGIKKELLVELSQYRDVLKIRGSVPGRGTRSISTSHHPDLLSIGYHSTSSGGGKWLTLSYF